MRLPFIVIFFLLIHLCNAAVRTVTNTNDNDVGSLRYTINTASDDDTIVFSPTVFTGNATIRLTTGPIVLSRQLTVTGPRNEAGENKITLTGDKDNSGTYTVGDSHVFEIRSSGVLVENFNISTSGSSTAGGAVAIFSGTNAANITISGCRFTGNRSPNGGAIYGTLNYPVQITGCTFENNVTGGSGGAIHLRGSSAATITSCTFSGNTAGSGGAVYLFRTVSNITGSHFTGNTASSGGGGINSDTSTTTVQQSAFSANQATSGGGIYFSGGTTSGTGIVRNSTFHGNSTTAGGAAIFATTTPGFTLTHCTLTGNTSNRSGAGNPGGALQNSADGIVRIASSIIAGNTNSRNTGTKTPDIHRIGGSITSEGGNIIGNTSGLDGAAFAPPQDRTGTAAQPLNPGLLPFGNHGGPTPTCPLLPLIPAVDFAPPGSFATDQRGQPRLQGPAPDSGAFERSVTSYSVWAENELSEFPASEREAGDDPDHDGIPNAIEYLVGSDPAIAGAPAHHFSIQTGQILLTLPISDSASPVAINARLAESDDLSEWIFTSIANHPSAILQSSSGPTHIYRLTLDTTGKPRRFVRLVAGD